MLDHQVDYLKNHLKGSEEQAVDRNKPNIVVIMADQMAFDVIGALGHPVVQTPNIDKLTSHGVVFSNCYCNSPLCAPSRASFVTGKLVSNHKAYDNGAELPASIPTFMHHLRRVGYETVLSGKMHFVGPDQLHGFEQRLTTDIYPAAFYWTPNWARGAYANPGASVKRVKNSGLCHWNRQMTYDEEVLYRSLEKIRQFGGTNREKPFFLCASFTHPHDPFLITKKYWNRYEGKRIPLPAAPAVPLDKLHPYNRWIQVHHEADVYTFSEEEIANARRAYYGMVTYFDELVGKLADELERLDLMRNTVIIVTSDHGEMLGEHGMWFKRTFYDPAAKVPLIVSWPGVLRGGRRVNQTVSLVDLSATLMKLAEVPDADDWISEFDGDSFHRLLEREDAGWKDEAICEYYAEGTVHPMVALRQGRYKYVHVHEQESLLYDLEADPLEMTDISKQPEASDVAAKMRGRIVNETDFASLEREIFQSQKERLMLVQALKSGQKASWDYQPYFDASRQYVRE
jgi:choline-sulfatase